MLLVDYYCENNDSDYYIIKTIKAKAVLNEVLSVLHLAIQNTTNCSNTHSQIHECCTVLTIDFCGWSEA